MGSGIAQVASMAGFQVYLADLQESTLEKGLQSIDKNLSIAIEKGKLEPERKLEVLGKISSGNQLPSPETSLVIEVIVEKTTVKQQFFKEVEAVVSPSCIIASNTSSLSIDELAEPLQHKNRFAGLHFFNPAHLMPLVEVVKGTHTSTEVMSTLVDFCKALQKKPVVCLDSPGFIVNRVARPFYAEALFMLEKGEADIETIDAMAQQAGFKMGPFTLMDLIGNDVNFAVTTSVFEGLGKPERFTPSPIQKEKVETGKLGRKTGEGFYKY